MTEFATERSIRALLQNGITRLREANVPSYTLAAELLLLAAMKRDRTWIYSHPEEVLPESSAAGFFELISRRAAGEPTQYLTGKQEFWGMEFLVSRDVLIPRPETEHLVEVALDRLAVREIRVGRPVKLTGENVTLVDIGTGSGCIAVALAKELSKAKIYATDISAAALNIARQNAERLGFKDRVQFVESNLFENIARTSGQPPFDLVVSNPPYISRRDRRSLSIEVREHEPAVALFGGEEGYELYPELIAQAAEHLNPQGLLVLELGYDSLPAVQPLLDAAEWTNIGVTHDLAGIPRVLSAERRSCSV